MIACDGLQFGIELDHQPIGTRWRPGFVNAHRPYRTALEGFEKASTGGQRRCDPVAAFDLPHHILAVGILTQDQFDQAIAWREEAQEIAAGLASQASRVAG